MNVANTEDSNNTKDGHVFMSTREFLDASYELEHLEAKKISEEYRKIHPRKTCQKLTESDRRFLSSSLKFILALITSVLLIYIFCFNIYMAYTTSGIAAAVVTLLFLPISYIVWFVIVALNNGIMNAYCITWIVSLVLSLVVLSLEKKRNA